MDCGWVGMGKKGLEFVLKSLDLQKNGVCFSYELDVKWMGSKNWWSDEREWRWERRCVISCKCWTCIKAD